MRRVLFIAYLFPPEANSGTRRSLCFSNHLPDLGWEPVVLTVEHRHAKQLDQNLLLEVRAGTRIERVPLTGDVWARRIGRCFPPLFRGKIERGLAWRLQAVNQVPDAWASWIKPAVARGLSLHHEQAFDAIYASGSPWSSFLVAEQISKRVGIPYVMDYRDNWNPIGTAGANLWDRQNPRQAAQCPDLERSAAGSAAAVITVTTALARAMAGSTGRTDFFVITNGFEPADFVQSRDSVRDGLLRITYTGVWRLGYGLHDLYQAIAKLKQERAPVLQSLRVNVAGFAPGPAREHGVDDIVKELGLVSHSKALELMQQADVQFLPVPSGLYAEACLPGKIFEYMGSRRPILALAPATSEVAQALKAVGGAACLEPGDVDGIATLLQRLHAGESVFSSRRPEELQRYTRAATTAQLAAVLDMAVRTAGPERQL